MNESQWLFKLVPIIFLSTSATRALKPAPLQLARFIPWYETGLDYFEARHYSSIQGRFSSIDPLLASGHLGDPQTFNRYPYVRNNPLNLIDPTGMISEGVLHGDSDNRAEALSKSKELLHQDLPWIKSQDRKVVPKPPTKFGPPDSRGSREILEDDDVIVSNISAPAVSANDGIADTSFAFSASGFAASGGEFYFVNGSKWRGVNGTYNITWGGNQYTGARSLAVAKARIFKVANKAFFFVGAGISGYQAWQNFREHNYAGAAKNCLDICMSGVATFGGPYGVAIGGVYFVGDTIGWKNISDSHDQFVRDVERASGMPYRKYMGPIY